MSDTCTEVAPLLAAGPLGILDDRSRALLDRHLASGCDECRGLADDLRAALGPTLEQTREATRDEARLGSRSGKPSVEAPTRALDAVLARVAREDAARGDAARENAARVKSAGPAVVLACTSCRAALDRREAVLCAGCFAPVHDACFPTRGACATPGCSETRSVRPGEPALPPRRTRAWPLIALVASGAVAALVGDRALRNGLAPEAPSRPVVALPSSSPAAPEPVAPSPAAPEPVSTPEPSALVAARPTGPTPSPEVAPSPVSRPQRRPSPSPEAVPTPEAAGPSVPQVQIFARAELSPDMMPLGVELKDGAVIPIAPNLPPEQLRKVQALLLTLQPGTRVTIRLRNGALVDLDKAKPAARAPRPQHAQRDAIERMGLDAGDTVRVGLLVTGRVVAITTDELQVREWRGDGSWGEVRAFGRDSLPPVEIVSLRSKKRYPIASSNGGASEVVLEIEQCHVASHSRPLSLRATVWHDASDLLLSGAVLRFEAKRPDAGSAPFATDEVPLSDLLPGDRVVEEREYEDAEGDFADGDVTLELDPARNLIPARSELAKTATLHALATRESGLAPVWTFLAQSGDPGLELLLAWTRIELSETALESERRSLDDALEAGGGAAAQALVDHVRSSDADYRLPALSSEGRLVWREAGAQAVVHKRRELELLGRLAGTLTAERARQLLAVYLERGTELGAGVVAVYEAQPRGAVEGLLDAIADVACARSPQADDVRRAESATQALHRLGFMAIPALYDRLEASLDRTKGQVIARKLQRLEDPATDAQALSDAIDQAILVVVNARRTERHGQLASQLGQAREKASERRWREALALVESVLGSDPANEEGSHVLGLVLVELAKDELAAKRRGPAAALLERALADEAKNPQAASLLGQILLEAAKEDADAVCVRAGPGEGWAVLARPGMGFSLVIATGKDLAAVEDWIPVQLEQGRGLAWIHGANGVASLGGVRINVHRTTGAPALVRDVLARVARLAPELQPAAAALDGELWLRDAEDLYDEGRYAEALAHYDQGARLCPGDPRLSHRLTCQLHVNGALLATFAVGVLLALGLAATRLRSRRVRVEENGAGKKGAK